MPSLSARLMGLDNLGVASYLLTLYFSSPCSPTTPSASSKTWKSDITMIMGIVSKAPSDTSCDSRRLL